MVGVWLEKAVGARCHRKPRLRPRQTGPGPAMSLQPCPVCGRMVPEMLLEHHVNRCLDRQTHAASPGGGPVDAVDLSESLQDDEMLHLDMITQILEASGPRAQSWREMGLDAELFQRSLQQWHPHDAAPPSHAAIRDRERRRRQVEELEDPVQPRRRRYRTLRGPCLMKR